MNIRNFLFSTLLFTSLFPKTSHLQCPLTVIAGPDKLVCSPGSQATLNGSISGTYLGFNWSPTTGLNNPGSLTPSATVNGPATYTLSAQAFDPSAPNLVTNGDFEAGNTGFTSSYTYNPQPSSPGSYTITTSPSLVFSSFPPCDDHTYGNGTGNMMLVNGAGSPGANIWCQMIAVMPNTYYFMSAWVASSPFSPPQLQFQVNNTPAGTPFQTSGGGCNWQQFSASWFSGNAVSATLCIVSLNSGNGFFGDDFALDDISFSAACTVSDQVSVDVVQVDAVLPFSVFLPCNAAQSGIPLDGSASTAGPNITYQWTGPGIISGANTPVATVNAEGTYTLTVTYSNGLNTCTDAASIEVLPDPNIVIAGAVAPNNLNCQTPAVTLDGGNSSSGPGITYNWTYTPAPGGIPPGIVSGGNTLYPIVNQPGSYTLTVTNSSSGCTASATASVSANYSAPVAMAHAPDTLECGGAPVNVSGNGSSTGGNMTYLWSTTSGNILSGQTTLAPLVNVSGLYTLTVTNTSNGCTATAAATVIAATTGNITAEAGDPLTLTCAEPTATLDGTGSSTGTAFTYLWTFQPPPGGGTGGIVSGETTLMPVVDENGLYFLTVTDTLTGCFALDSVAVGLFASYPFVQIAPADTITCANTTVTLNGMASSGAPFSYEWDYLTAGGTGNEIVSGENTLTPVVNAAGAYLLTVTNTLNGCTAAAVVIVQEDVEAPLAEAGPTFELSCSVTSAFLNGAGSSSGQEFIYTWTTADGNITGGGNTLTPGINSPGTYTLTVTNTDNGCFASDLVLISQDANVPVADAGNTAFLTCDQTTVTLDGSGSSTGTGFSYQWTTQDGHIVSGAATLTPVVDVTGTYLLHVVNTGNNCESFSSVLVMDFTQAPTVNTGTPPVLNCVDTVVVLQANASGGSSLTWNWSTMDGNILQGGSTAAPSVNAPGVYMVTVTNQANGCSATATAMVTENAATPSASVEMPPVLTCMVNEITLDGSGSSQGSNFYYSWTTPNGNILTGSDSLMAVVNATGMYTLQVTNQQNGCTASFSVIVTSDGTPPVAAIAQPPVLTCTLNEITLDGSGSASGQDFGYAWFTPDGNIVSGETALNPVIDAPGNYYLTVSNQQNGCTSTAVTQVTENTALPVADAGNGVSLGCTPGGTAVLDGTGSSQGSDFTYQWTTPDGNITAGANTLTPTINSQGTYTLTVTDQLNGCSALSVVTVTDGGIPPVAVVNTPGMLNCSITQLSLDASASSVGANFTYSWTTTGGNILAGANSLTPSIDAPGTYTLVVMNQQNGCTATAMTTVTDDVTPPFADAGTGPVFDCNSGSTLILHGENSSTGTGFTYQWTTPDGIISSGAQTLTPAVSTPGTYILAVMNGQNGCIATDTVVVSENTTSPEAIIEVPAMLTCEKTELSLDASGSTSGPVYFYSWSTGNGNIVSGENSLAPVIDAPGSYSLLVTNQQNGCTDSAAVVITENTQEPGAFAAADTISCKEFQVALSGSSPTLNVMYAWTTQDGHFLFGETSPTPGVDATGTYTLTVTNPANGCTSVASVTVVKNILEDFDFDIKNPDCVTGIGQIVFTSTTGGTPPYRYSIDGGASFSAEPVFDNLAPGIYELLVKDDENCILTGTAVLADPPVITIDLEPSVMLYLGDAWQMEPKLNILPNTLAEIEWKPAEGLSCPDCLRPELTPFENAVFTLTVTDVNGCTASASIAVTVLRRLDVYVPNAFSPNGDGINDVLMIFAKANQIAVVRSFKIFTRWGESVFTGTDFQPNDPAHGWDGMHRGRKLDAGVYVWFAEVELLNGDREVLKGEVVLLR